MSFLLSPWTPRGQSSAKEPPGSAKGGRPSHTPAPTLANIGSLLPRPERAQPRAAPRDSAPAAEPDPDSLSFQDKVRLFAESLQTGTGQASKNNVTTLANLGSLLKRPESQQSFQALTGNSRSNEAFASPRGEEGVSLRQAMTARGGVIRAKDGFEVFYGVEEQRCPATARGSTSSRDGFEEFYEIEKPTSQRRPRHSAPAQAVSSTCSTRHGVQADSVVGLSGSTDQGAKDEPSTAPSKPRRGSAQALSPAADELKFPASVQTFSLCEEPAIPDGVQVFTLSRNAQVPKTPRDKKLAL